MKEKVQTLQDFGEVLHAVRSEMGYATSMQRPTPMPSANS